MYYVEKMASKTRRLRRATTVILTNKRIELEIMLFLLLKAFIRICLNNLKFTF